MIAPPITTLSQFLSRVDELTTADQTYAYRGQTNSRYRLQSAATRRLIATHGAHLLKDASVFQNRYLKYHTQFLLSPVRTRALLNTHPDYNSDLQALATLQHHGAATGLLDFSYSPLVALWFATRDNGADGMVYVLQTDSPRTLDHQLSLQQTPLCCLFFPKQVHETVNTWEPALVGDALQRIVAQRSIFVIDQPLTIDDIPLAKLVIDSGSKWQIRRSLKSAGVDEYSLFNDVAGFAQNNTVDKFIPYPIEDSLMIGASLYHSGEYIDSAAYLTAHIRHSGPSADTYALRANAHAGSGKYEQALQDYEKAMDEAPSLTVIEPFAVCFNKGNALANLGRLAEAIREFSRSIELNSAYPAAYFNRGNAYFASNRFRDALNDYEQSRSITASIFNMGNCFAALGEFKRALECYEIADKGDAASRRAAANRLVMEHILKVVEGADWHFLKLATSTDNIVSVSFGKDPSPQVISLPFPLAGNTGNVGFYGTSGFAGGDGGSGSNPLIINLEDSYPLSGG